MAQLRGLGQPFGSPGGIINIPAPAGSALAGQIQMQSMQGLGQALGQYLGQKRQQELWQQDLQNYQMAQQSQLPPGQVGPQMGMPQMQSRIGQQAQMQSQLANMFADPLDREYKVAQIESTKALTGRRKEEEKQALPDRMLRQADRYLRVVDDIMSEYWYTPEGPYRDKLLKDVQRNREKALGLIEKYAPNSEAAKEATQRLAGADKEIKKAKQAPPIKEQIKPIGMRAGKVVSPKRYIVDRYAAPRNKKEFDGTLSRLRSEAEKDRWFDLHWKPEYGTHK